MAQAVQKIVRVLLDELAVGLVRRLEGLAVRRLFAHGRERFALGKEEVGGEVRGLGLLARHRERRIDVDGDQPDDLLSFDDDVEPVGQRRLAVT